MISNMLNPNVPNKIVTVFARQMATEASHCSECNECSKESSLDKILV